MSHGWPFVTLIMMEFHFCLSSADRYAAFIDKPVSSLISSTQQSLLMATTCNTSLHKDLLQVVPLSSGYVTKVLKLVFVNFWGQGWSIFSYQIPNKNIGFVFFPWYSQHSPPAPHLESVDPVPVCFSHSPCFSPIGGYWEDESVHESNFGSSGNPSVLPVVSQWDGWCSGNSKAPSNVLRTSSFVDNQRAQKIEVINYFNILIIESSSVKTSLSSSLHWETTHNLRWCTWLYQSGFKVLLLFLLSRWCRLHILDWWVVVLQLKPLMQNHQRIPIVK